MLKDITLGQYFPGSSVIHRLDPRTKLISVVIYIVALFCAESWVSYGVMLAFLLAAITISGIPPKSIVRGMKPLIVILIFTGVLNLFFTEGQTVCCSHQKSANPLNLKPLRPKRSWSPQTAVNWRGTLL